MLQLVPNRGKVRHISSTRDFYGTNLRMANPVLVIHDAYHVLDFAPAKWQLDADFLVGAWPVTSVCCWGVNWHSKSNQEVKDWQQSAVDNNVDWQEGHNHAPNGLTVCFCMSLWIKTHVILIWFSRARRADRHTIILRPWSVSPRPRSTYLPKSWSLGLQRNHENPMEIPCSISIVLIN